MDSRVSSRRIAMSLQFEALSGGASREDWELDSTFLINLAEWFRHHPGNNIDRVFVKVCTAIDLSQDFIEFIPDNPFPARELVKCLARLVQLEKALPNANLELGGFALAVVDWVINVQKWLESARSRNFTKPTWKNLSTARFYDERWIHSTRNTKAEIKEFKALIDETGQLFRDASLVRISWGVDAVFRILGRDDERIGAVIHILIKRVTETRKDHAKNIQKEHNRKTFLQQCLHAEAVATFTYAQQKKVPCVRGTRTDIFADIRRWIDDISDTSPNFLWLTGDPGCGKSSIAASVVQECLDRGILLAQLFINRAAVETMDPKWYFYTIAHQLCAHSEDLEREIYSQMKDYKIHTSNINRIQSQRLFMQPLRKGSSLDRSSPLVVVIDGLDETESSGLKGTATIFAELFDAFNLRYRNVKVLISSRLEDSIQQAFTAPKVARYIQHMHLDMSQSFEDVSEYIRSRLTEILEEHGLDPETCVGTERIGTLAKMASGLFLRADAIVKIIHRHLTTHGSEGLTEVLDTLPAKIDAALLNYFKSGEMFVTPADEAGKLDPPALPELPSSLCSKTVSALCGILNDPTPYRRLLGCTGRSAQVILDACQLLLDSYGIPGCAKRQIIAAMQRLSGKTQLYSQRFMLQGPISLLEIGAVDSGGYGDIYKATSRGKVLCLKTLRPNKAMFGHTIKLCAKEATIWSQLSHPNILPFYGLHLVDYKISFVAPWAENGNVRQYLQETHPSPNRVLLCADTAAGVVYLHTKGMVHGDIKAANVLVDRSGRAYLADFGLSNVDDSRILRWASQSSAASKGGTVRHQAPELHPADDSGPITVHNTKKTDVFAWGCFAYEVGKVGWIIFESMCIYNGSLSEQILTGRTPYYECRGDSCVIHQIMQGVTPSRPSDGSDAWLTYGLNERLWGLLKSCWAFDPANRPDMAAVVSQLELENLPDQRPAPEWPLGSANRFRNSQGTEPQEVISLLEELDAILARSAAIEEH
ncbi:hypothetical protein DXG01_015575 [Tephrocybe rancida]|nr:hypothetical protein DXG01_015575 [Tephrocybe rancida]